MSESLSGEGPTVPAPVPPEDADAWYAPDVRAQRETHPGVVATVREEDGFAYEVREPALTERERVERATIEEHFSDANLRRPRTREGTRERAATGFEGKYARALDRLLSGSADSRRRVGYYAMRDLRCLGELTPLALDERVEVGDTTGERLFVHTENFAPARTTLRADHEFLERFLAERLERHTVSFREFDVPVVVYRERLLGTDAFDTKYAVLEPELLPGDEALIEACKDRIWESNVDAVVEDKAAFVRERAREFLNDIDVLTAPADAVYTGTDGGVEKAVRWGDREALVAVRDARARWRVDDAADVDGVIEGFEDRGVRAEADDVDDAVQERLEDLGYA